MSAVNHTQVNNKKGSQIVNNGAVSNAPVQTANASVNMTPVQIPTPSQSTSPPANNAPKYGTLVPNRVFVGGISANTTEGELTQLFSAYGTVKATKIISDRAGVSKGYGFVTFECEEDAKRLQRESDNIMLRERKLNIAPAIKKQPFSRAFDVPSPPSNQSAAAAAAAAAQTQFYYGGVPFGYQNGVAYFTPPPPGAQSNGAGDAAAAAVAAAQTVYQTPTVYAAAPAAATTPAAAAPPPYHAAMTMYPPQALYMPQQYPYQPVHYDPHQFYPGGTQNFGAHQQYMYSGSSNGGLGSSNGPAVGAQPPASSATSTSSPTGHGYYQQFAAYGPDNLYYNVPMYNVAIEPSVGVYATDGLEPTAANAFAEIQPHHNYQQSSMTVRRNRRNNPRRGGPQHHGGLLQGSEVGAGDAPLQPVASAVPAEIMDVCKKMDSIQL